MTEQIEQLRRDIDAVFLRFLQTMRDATPPTSDQPPLENPIVVTLTPEPTKPVPDEKWLAEISARVEAIPEPEPPAVPEITELPKSPELLASTDDRFAKLVKWVVATGATPVQITDFLIQKGLYIEASQETHFSELRKFRAAFLKNEMSISEVLGQHMMGVPEKEAFIALHNPPKKN
jgi:hypothetical protein